MKKILVILVALVGFGLSLNAQNVYVSNVETVPSVNGKDVTIYVTVKGVLDDANSCSLGIKVCPTTRNVLDVLYIDCEYGDLLFERFSGGPSKYAETKVTFSCTLKQNEEAPRCGAYDFDVTVTNNGCK